MPTNPTGTQITTALNAAVAKFTSTTGTTPVSDTELLNITNEVLEKCFDIAPDLVLESAFSISPTHTGTPTVRFKHA